MNKKKHLWCSSRVMLLPWHDHRLIIVWWNKSCSSLYIRRASSMLSHRSYINSQAVLFRLVLSRMAVFQFQTRMSLLVNGHFCLQTISPDGTVARRCDMSNGTKERVIVERYISPNCLPPRMNMQSGKHKKWMIGSSVAHLVLGHTFYSNAFTKPKTFLEFP